MYFVDVTSLKSDLSAGSLPSHEQLKYLFAYVVLSVIPHSSEFSATPGWETPDWINWGAATSVQIGGILACYAGNGGASGPRFLERLISLSFVVGIRWIPGGLLLVLVGAFALTQFGVSDLGESVAFRLFLPAVGALIYYATYLEFRSLNAAAA